MKSHRYFSAFSLAAITLVAFVTAGLVTINSSHVGASVASIEVTTLNDAGAGSLRAAIENANSNAGDDIITFTGGLTGTITLASNLPAINGNGKVTIVGPGQSVISVSGSDAHRLFTVIPGKELAISDITLKSGANISEVGGLIHNERGVVTATDVTFSDMTSGRAVFSLGNLDPSTLALATYTDCTFTRLHVGIAGDHGLTPNTVSDESAYNNRTYVIDSTFTYNYFGIAQQRFTKIENSTFSNNTVAARIDGLNRTQVLSSSFLDNNTGLRFGNWVPTDWTSIGRNNRFVNDNIFRRNIISLQLNDVWNDSKSSQQWSTITDNEWDGLNTWISAGYFDGSNKTATVTTLNSAERDWFESGNFITPLAPSISLSSNSRTVTQNEAMPSLYTVTNTGGTIASYSINPTPSAGLSFSTSTGFLTGTPTVAAQARIYTVTATNSGGTSFDTFTLTIVEESQVTTTPIVVEVVPTTTASEVTTAPAAPIDASAPVSQSAIAAPAPVEPLAPLGQSKVERVDKIARQTVATPMVQETPQTTSTTTLNNDNNGSPPPIPPKTTSRLAGVMVDGIESSATVTRSNNTLNVVGGGVIATVSGVSPEGERISLDVDGNLWLSDGDQIVVEASGFVSGEKIGVWLFSTPAQLGSLTADATGKISGRFALPSDVESGDHRLVLEGVNSDGSSVILGLGIAVGEIESSSTLARLLIAIPVALAIGLGLLIPTTLRRRRLESALV